MEIAVGELLRQGSGFGSERELSGCDGWSVQEVVHSRESDGEDLHSSACNTDAQDYVPAKM
jgi:hypothetical protein